MAANIKFVNSRFRDAIHGHGFQVLWEKNEMCICYNSETSEAVPTCPYCGGLHFIWRPYGVIPALIVGVKEIRRQIVDFTKVSEGDVAITTLPEHKFAINDRIRLVHSKETYSETIEAKYNEHDEKVFVPYYEIAEFESIIGEENIPIDLSRVVYNSATDEIKINGYLGEKIAVRYKHFPFYLISELLHSNRQQWSSDVGQGYLENLPNQYLAKRITTKLKTAYKRQLIEDSVVVDLWEQIQEQTKAYSQEFESEQTMKFAPEQQPITVPYSIYGANVKGFYSVEMFFFQQPGSQIFKIEDDFDEVRNITSPISSIQDIIKFQGYLQEGMTFLYLRDKYAQDYVFTQLDPNTIITYLGGDINNVSSWRQEQPFDKLMTVSEFDFINNVDCEILIRQQTKYIYNEQDNEWHSKNKDFIAKLSETSELLVQIGEDVITLDAKATESKNYLVFRFSNNGAFRLSGAYLNGSTISFQSTIELKGFGANKKITFLDNSGSLIEARIYSKALDLFEMLQNMNFLQSATHVAGQD